MNRGTGFEPVSQNLFFIPATCRDRWAEPVGRENVIHYKDTGARFGTGIESLIYQNTNDRPNGRSTQKNKGRLWLPFQQKTSAN